MLSKYTGGWPDRDSWCTDLPQNTDCWMGKTNCYATESPQNNWIALRQIDDARNSLYVEFQRGNQASKNIDFMATDFVEYYPDVTSDPWHMRNLVQNQSESVLQ